MKAPRSCQDPIAPGVFIEVLWDLEKVNDSGRRQGERAVVSIWWRAEVLDTEVIEGRRKAQLRYEERDGFAQQCGEVWVFPGHVRLVEDDSTQLRWRFYECSGNVSYEVDPEPELDDDWNTSSKTYSPARVRALEEHVSNLMQKYESLERMVVAQTQLYTALIGTGSRGDRICARLFAILRQKVAILMQRPIPGMKNRKDNTTTSSRDDGDGYHSILEESSVGSLKTGVDCDLQDFENVARFIRSRAESAYFRPGYADTQTHSGDLDVAEVTFGSLSQLCRVIGITAYSDMRCMAFREKGNPRDSEQASLDSAIRILGTYVMDETDENSPSAIIFCRAIDKPRLRDTVLALTRLSREYDFASMAYRHALMSERLSAQSLIKRVFSSRVPSVSTEKESEAITGIVSQLRNFTLRWRRTPTPSARFWTRSLVTPENVSGLLEIEFPFIIVRGPETIREVMCLADESFMREQLQADTTDGANGNMSYTVDRARSEQ